MSFSSNINVFSFHSSQKCDKSTHVDFDYDNIQAIHAYFFFHLSRVTFGVFSILFTRNFYHFCTFIEACNYLKLWHCVIFEVRWKILSLFWCKSLLYKIVRLRSMRWMWFGRGGGEDEGSLVIVFLNSLSRIWEYDDNSKIAK